MNVKKIAAFAIGPIGGALLGLITLPIITWYYSAEDIGRIAMLQVVASFCVLIFSLGLDQAYVRDYHESNSRSKLLREALLPGFVLLLVFLLFFLSTPYLISKSLFSIEDSVISFTVALCFLAGFLSRFLSLILRMQEDGLAFSMGQILPKFLFLLIVSIYVLFSFDFNFYYLLLAHALSIFTLTLVYALNTREVWIAALREKIDVKNVTAMLSFGAPLILGGAAYWGLTAMDKLFLRNMSTFGQLGIYAVASSFAAAGMVLQSVFSVVWAPTVYKWAAEGCDFEKVDLVTDYILALVVLVFSLAGIFSWLVSFVLPGDYWEVQYILVACMAYPLFYTLSEASGVGLGVARKSGYSMMASLIAVLINFVGNYLLVPRFGAAGAAVSTAFSFWCFLLCRTEFSCLVWRKFPRLKLYVLTLLCTAGSIGTALFGAEYKVVTILSWGVLGVAGGVIYRKYISLLFLAFMRYVYPHD